jgi:hypothetical protein
MKNVLQGFFVTLVAFTCICFGAFVLLRAIAAHQPLDATDNRTTGERSGMQVLVDNETGCQYLFRGGLTPRLDGAGKPFCKKVPS